MLPWDQAEPSREVSATSKGRHVGRESLDRQCGQRADPRHCLQPLRRDSPRRQLLELLCLGIDPLRLLGDLINETPTFLADQFW